MRNGILGSMATLAMGAGLAFGQAVPTLPGGLRAPSQTPVYAPPVAGAFPMSMPADPGSAYPGQYILPPQAGTGFPGQYVSPPQVGPAYSGQFDQSIPTGLPVPGQPLMLEPGAGDNEDGPRDRDASDYGPGPCPYRLWGSAEYLLWWVKPGLNPNPLATTGPASTAAILNQPGVSVVLGGKNLDYQEHSGIRATFGFWADKEGRIGAEVSGFLLGDKTVNQAVASDANGDQVFARPVFNALENKQAASLVSSPGQLAGSIRFDSSSQFYGAEANFLGSMFRSKYVTADMIIGFRYLGLDEKLNVISSTSVLGGGITAFNGQPVGPGGTVGILDHFETRNDFYGGQVGGRAQVRWNRLYADLEGKLAVGNAHEVVTVTGLTTLSGTGAGVVPGGLLAVASNSGLASRDEFTFVPEGAVKVGVHITDYISAFVGYTFIYWFEVARPGAQIDLAVNPTQVPSNLSFGNNTGPARPFLPFGKTDFWAQGVSVGLEIRY